MIKRSLLMCGTLLALSTAPTFANASMSASQTGFGPTWESAQITAQFSSEDNGTANVGQLTATIEDARAPKVRIDVYACKNKIEEGQLWTKKVATKTVRKPLGRTVTFTVQRDKGQLAFVEFLAYDHDGHLVRGHVERAGGFVECDKLASE